MTISLVGAYLSNKFYKKNIVFIGLHLISLITEKRITLLDVLYSIIGWLSFVIWLVSIYSE